MAIQSMVLLRNSTSTRTVQHTYAQEDQSQTTTYYCPLSIIHEVALSISSFICSIFSSFLGSFSSSFIHTCTSFPSFCNSNSFSSLSISTFCSSVSLFLFHSGSFRQHDRQPATSNIHHRGQPIWQDLHDIGSSSSSGLSSSNDIVY